MCKNLAESFGLSAEDDAVDVAGAITALVSLKDEVQNNFIVHVKGSVGPEALTKLCSLSKISEPSSFTLASLTQKP